MQLYKIGAHNPDKELGYDCSYGFVVRAENEADARKLAATSTGDEGPEFWLDVGKSFCKPVANDGQAGIILVDFLAG